MHSFALRAGSNPPDALNHGSREAVLARYRRYRALSREHDGRILGQAPGEALLNQAHRLGLARGSTLLTEHADALRLALDLIIHAGQPDRAIDRYARTAAGEPGSHDRPVLEAMRQARFAILGVERRHEIAGLIVRDVSSLGELWLVDERLEARAETDLFATRLVAVDDFHITTGVVVPVDEALLRDVFREVPFLEHRPWAGMVADPRFAEALYRLAIARGIMERRRCPEAERDDKAA
jgi:hypothetical protein